MFGSVFQPISDLPENIQPKFYDYYRPIFKAVGFTEMTRCRGLEMYNQASSRLQLITDCAKQMCNDSEGYSSEDYEMLSEQLLCEAEIVNDVLTQLDIYNTIDHPEQSDDWFLEKYGANPSTILRKYISMRPARDLRDDYGIVKKPHSPDEVSRMLVKAQANARKNEMVQRIHNEMTLRHSQGWYFVFDTLTIAPDAVARFYEDKTALRNYFRNVGRKVLSAEGRAAKESSKDCYSYICVPEYGGEHGRLHFHVIHMVRTLPSGTVS